MRRLRRFSFVVAAIAIAAVGAAGTITGPNTGSGPSGSGASLAGVFAAAMLFVGGAGASTLAYRVRQR